MDDSQFLTGFPVMPIAKNLIFPYVAQCQQQGIKYGMGDKDPVLGAFPPDYSMIDCSGFFRTIIYYLTEGATKTPDGSWNELAWLKAQGFKVSDVPSTGLIDNVVRVSVYEEPGKTGHIWGTYQGKTFESHGSVGPSSRAWNDPILASLAQFTTVFAIA